VIVLLFPFYWMAITSFKPDNELLSRTGNPFWVVGPTLAHFDKLLFETEYPAVAVEHGDGVGVSTFVSLAPRCSRPMRSSGCASRAAKPWGGAIFLAYLVPPSILFIPLAAIVVKLGLFDTPLGADPDLSDVPDPVLHLAPDGLLPLDPGYELEECALIDGASRWQILVKIVLPLAVPGLISAGIFAFTLSWNEFIYALTFISSSRTRRCRSAWSPNWCKATSTSGGR
jgi:multiple sugar transport system permease protein